MDVQTYKIFEWIIINDDSTDNLNSVIRDMIHKCNIIPIDEITYAYL